MVKISDFITVGFAISLLANAIFFIPQAVKIYKRKSANEVSLLTFLGFNIIQIFTGVHAYLVNDIILCIGSILAFITCGSVTILTFIYKTK